MSYHLGHSQCWTENKFYENMNSICTFFLQIEKVQIWCSLKFFTSMMVSEVQLMESMVLTSVMMPAAWGILLPICRDQDNYIPQFYKIIMCASVLSEFEWQATKWSCCTTMNTKQGNEEVKSRLCLINSLLGPACTIDITPSV